MTVSSESGGFCYGGCPLSTVRPRVCPPHPGDGITLLLLLLLQTPLAHIATRRLRTLYRSIPADAQAHSSLYYPLLHQPAIRTMLSRFLLPLCAVVLLSAVLARAEVASHEITSLPGWSGKLPSRHFSGYFPTTINGSSGSSDGMLHYYLTLSESKPETDPLVVWLQGGPGCSSLFGMLYENGQLHFSGDTDKSGLPTLAANPFAWTKVANMLFLEQPVGVGFSYCRNNCSCDREGCPFGVDAYNFLVSRYSSLQASAHPPD